MRRNNALPRNIVSTDGRLYFNKWFRGVRYNGSLKLSDSMHNRKCAGHISSKIRAEMNLGTFNPADYPMFADRYGSTEPSDFPTFEDYAAQWLHEKKLRVANATIRTYRDLIKNHLTPYFGKFPIDQVTKPAVEKWLQQVTQKISRTHANDCLRRLKSIIYDAEADFLFVSHLHRVKPLKCYEPHNSTKNEIFTLAEASRIFFIAGARLKSMMLCSMLAGLRTGEVIAVQRDNIDFERNLLHVKATMSEGERKTPKSKAGVRSIQMHPVLRLHLAQMLASHSHEFVFISERGNPFRVRQDFDREYRLVKEKAKVRNLRWYAFRKLYASLRYACNDAVPSAISKAMGHKDVATTLNTYAEAMPHMNCRFDQIEFPLPPTFLTIEKSA